MRTRLERNAGRASCWLIGGIGCLVLAVVMGVLIVYGLREFEKSGFVSSMKQSASQMERVEQEFSRIASAIDRYKRDHNGAYPSNLKALVPQYLPAETLKPVQVDEKTTVQWVYTPPKQTDGADTIVFTHKPAVKFRMEFFGHSFEQFHTYYLRKDGELYIRQEMPLSQYRSSRSSPGSSGSP